MRMSQPGPIAGFPLELVELPDLEPAPLELTVKVGACAICRTDLQIVEGDLEPRRLPVTPGHQVVGTIAAVGSGVQGWSIGDRAMALLAGVGPMGLGAMAPQRFV